MKNGKEQQGSLPENDQAYSPEGGLKILAHIIAVRLAAKSPSAMRKIRKPAEQSPFEDKSG